MGWSSQITFKEFCDFLQHLLKTKAKPAKISRLKKFLDHWRARQVAGSEAEEEEKSLFPLMRLLVPQLDKERGVYNIKESVLADLYIEFLQLGKGSTDALKLKNYRAPKAGQDDAGDFAAVLFTVMQGRSYAATDISCAEVNQRLDDIVRANAEGGRRQVARILKEIFLKMDAMQQKWFVRVILKDMKVSLGVNSILQAFHPDARDLYDVTANLRKVCESLTDPSVRLNEIAIQLMQPFKPQLADRIPVRSLDKWLKGGSCYVETKYDGERLQVHKDGSRFRYFSRNGNEFTEDFGSDAAKEEELLTGYLAQSLAPHVKSIILDGEICAWNHQLGLFSQQSQYKSIRGLRPGHPTYQQCLVIYDICYLNGRVLTNFPLRDRILLYEAAVQPLPGRVQFTHRTRATGKAEVVAALNEAIDRRDEGLVLKDPDSVYKPNARAGGGWVKLKPEYENELMDQLDLLVLGGYYGSGGGGGTVTQFLMGLRDAEADRARYVAFCRVGSGYTDMELKDLVTKCGRPLKNQPASVVVSREKPTIWYEPTVAPVLQLNAADIVDSATYPAGCTLRFPRVQCLRPDRDHSNCTSIQELQKLRHHGEGKLYGGLHLVHEDDAESPRKRPRPTERPQLSARYTQVDYSLERIDTFHLKGRIVVVEPSLDVELKRRLERAVVRHGGSVEQNVRPGATSCYVQSEGKLRAKNVVNQGLVDVVRSSWLLDCEKEFRDYRPHDMVFTTKATSEKWKDLYDEFGDSFTDDSTADDLRQSLSQATHGIALSKSSSIRTELVNDLADYPYHLLRGKVFYFDRAMDGDERRLAELRCQLYGGTVSDQLSTTVTHVVVVDSEPPDGLLYRHERRNRVAAGRPLFHVVSQQWMRESIAAGKLLEEAEFEL